MNKWVKLKIWHIQGTIKYAEVSFPILSLQKIKCKIYTLTLWNSWSTILIVKRKKITTNFEPSNAEDIINIGCLDTKLAEVDRHTS